MGTAEGRGRESRSSLARHWPELVLALGAALVYLGFSPLTVSGMGYAGEELETAEGVLSAMRGGTPLGEIVWPRHGFLEVLIKVPFVGVGRWLAGDAGVDVATSLEPLLFTTAAVALLFAWARRLTGDGPFPFAAAVAAAFTTFLWPYAYYGMETTQSLALLVAAWVALTARETPRWPRIAAFALAAGVAAAVKSTGVMLLPALAYLGWSLVFGTGREGGTAGRVARYGLAAALVAVLLAANQAARAPYWDRLGGQGEAIHKLLVRDPWMAFHHFVGFFVSPNKGLCFYAPIVILALAALPSVWRKNRPIAVFALLTLLGPAAGFSFLMPWADETWGPRYLHVAVAPLLLCLVAARGDGSFSIRREWRFVGLALAGGVISLLGSLFYYGAIHGAAARAGQSTLQNLQFNPVWNHVSFNSRLLRAWLRSDDPSAGVWTPQNRWLYSIVPEGQPPAPTIDLGPYAQPQPLVLRGVSASGWIRAPAARWAMLFSVLAGGCLLGVVGRHCAGTAARAGPGAARPGRPGR
jgi:hypothetical protein